MDYVIHSGEGKVSPSGAIEYIDAGTLASLYGLSPGEYEIRSDYSPDAIHLGPRQDGKYTNIKNQLADNGQDFHYDYPAFMHTTRDGRYKNKSQIQPQYKASFRDRRKTNL